MPNSDDFDDVEIVPFEDKLVDKNLTWYHNDDKVHDRTANDNSKIIRYFDQGCKTASRSQDTIPSYFVPADVFLGGFKLAQFENLIEFINVDPHSGEEDLAAGNTTKMEETKKVFIENKINLPDCGRSDHKFPIIDTIDLSQEAQNKVEEEAIKEDSDDVVFVREYNLTSDKSKSIPKAKRPNEDPLTITETHGHQLRGRRVGLEKRKNPVRKAHIEKVHHDLIEKLSYHPSVFNAKVKKRKVKAPVVIDQSTLRQSCRTTGAIYCPPSPITPKNYKEWPTTAHEMPFYNEETESLELISNGPKVSQFMENRSITSGIKKKLLEEDKELSKNKSNLSLEKTMHSSLKNVMAYVKEVEECKDLLSSNDAVTNGFIKPTLYERNLQFRAMQTKDMNDEQPSIRNHSCWKLFESTCLLYAIIANKSQKDVENEIENMGYDEVTKKD